MRKLKDEVTQFYSLPMRMQIHETMPRATFAAIMLTAIYMLDAENVGAALYTGALAVVFILARVISATDARWNRCMGWFSTGPRGRKP